VESASSTDRLIIEPVDRFFEGERRGKKWGADRSQAEEAEDRGELKVLPSWSDRGHNTEGRATFGRAQSEDKGSVRSLKGSTAFFRPPFKDLRRHRRQLGECGDQERFGKGTRSTREAAACQASLGEGSGQALLQAVPSPNRPDTRVGMRFSLIPFPPLGPPTLSPPAKKFSIFGEEEQREDKVPDGLPDLSQDFQPVINVVRGVQGS